MQIPPCAPRDLLTANPARKTVLSARFERHVRLTRRNPRRLRVRRDVATNALLARTRRLLDPVHAMVVVRRVERPAVGNVARARLKIEVRRLAPKIHQRVEIQKRFVVARKNIELRRVARRRVRRKRQRRPFGNRALIENFARRVADVEEKLGALGVAHAKRFDALADKRKRALLLRRVISLNRRGNYAMKVARSRAADDDANDPRPISAPGTTEPRRHDV